MTNDDALAEKCRMFANHGALKKPFHMMEGINSRLDGLQASILSAKLPYILEWTKKRIDIAALYNKHLQGIPQIILPQVRPRSKHTYHLYVIRAEQRDGLMNYLKEREIETVIHYPSTLPNLPAYKYLGHTPADFPVASKFNPKYFRFLFILN
jgi:dTDP-4-amino-4,6-dideoxygalactose transaminase